MNYRAVGHGHLAEVKKEVHHNAHLLKQPLTATHDDKDRQKKEERKVLLGPVLRWS